eukprot:CAMPEP_0116921814 /NCGR_PEP_ID=MMETSP0467-20121206/21874_1 /TAXON_ID=283647 /ORGANISM="Mesodinium pulex, Strain SPMC105" /LENGTH=197 /DNA_ID=CAMNT_0004599993 /DNA_START=408 /DNA_END=1001 /DNA_ORIENTATION=+
MVEGKMEQTGACMVNIEVGSDPSKPNEIPTNKDSVSMGSSKGQCQMKEGTIFVAAPKTNSVTVLAGADEDTPSAAALLLKRNQSRHHLGEYNRNYSGKGVFERSRFKQNPNSLLDIPPYNSPNINGKGYTFNPHPEERFDDHSNTDIFKTTAYDSTRYSILKGGAGGDVLAKSIAEEEAKAIGGEPGQTVNKTALKN